MQRRVAKIEKRIDKYSMKKKKRKKGRGRGGQREDLYRRGEWKKKISRIHSRIHSRERESPCLLY